MPHSGSRKPDLADLSKVGRIAFTDLTPWKTDYHWSPAAIAARAFVENGAQVVIVCRRADAVDSAPASPRTSAWGVTGDVGDIAPHERVASLVAEQFGGVDIYDSRLITEVNLSVDGGMTLA